MLAKVNSRGCSVHIRFSYDSIGECVQLPNQKDTVGVALLAERALLFRVLRRMDNK